MKKAFIAGIFIILTSVTFGQVDDKAETPPSKTNDIGIGIGMVHMIAESAWAPGVHLHYGKSIGEKQRFSIGTGVEYLMGDHKHASIGLAFGYGLTPALSIGYGPGLEFHLGEGEDEDHGAHLSHHIELAYEFDLGFMHLGPMVEYGFSKEDQHVMIGLHSGINF